MRTTKVLSVSLPPEMLSRAEQLARDEDRTMSELVREALRSYEALRRNRPPSGSKKNARTAKSLK